MKLVVDTSIALKWVLAEVGSDQALGLLGRHELLAPDLIAAEAANALRRRVSRGLDPRIAEQALCALLTVPFHRRSSEPLQQRALALALLHRQHTYDCTFVALAEAEGAQLVTADLALIGGLRSTPEGRWLVTLDMLTAATS